MSTTATWERVGKRYGNPPCQICGKDDYCTFSPELKLILCMRVDSGRPSNNSMGGWLHSISGDVSIPSSRPKSRARENLPPPDFERIWMSWNAGTKKPQLESLAESLGVSIQSLMVLNFVWTGEAWAIPMKDETGKMIGIRIRSMDGNKFAVRGSRTGLFIPFIGAYPLPPTLYIVEGPTDTAAALTLGIYSIGRPTCSACVEMIKKFTHLHQKIVRRVVIIGDNDPRRCPKCKRPETDMKISHCPTEGMKLIQPGQEGAKRLKDALSLPTRIWTPPCKDLREFARQGGTREDIR